MKKYIIALLIALCLIIMPNAKAAGIEKPEVTGHEKIKIHLFYASWCSHCHDFIEYFSDKYDDYSDYFEINTYLVSYSEGNNSVTVQENYNIMSAVAEAVDKEMGFPLIVIGDHFSQSGFGSDGTDIIKTALEEYQSDSYVDLVSNIINENNLDDSKVEDFLNACTEAGIKCNGATESDKAGISDGVVIGIIFAVIILGFGGLVIYSRKK